uniref:ArsR/SmtB family transcription factor n=1 Tax=Candidatus Enterococcus willemsii TaxID=1857215 RepID=UPI00403F1C9B
MSNLSFYEEITSNDETLQRTLDVFHILRNEIRFKILLLLIQKETNVTEMMNVIKESQSAISHQLAKLKKSNLIKSRTDGRKKYYCLYDKHVESIIRLAVDHASEENEPLK